MIQSLLLSILVFAVASSTVNGARVDQPNPRVPSPINQILVFHLLIASSGAHWLFIQPYPFSRCAARASGSKLWLGCSAASVFLGFIS
jgi:hypothetical protein